MSKVSSRIHLRRRDMSTIQKFIRDDSGATAIEYGLIAGLVSVVIIVAVTAVGTKLSKTFNSVGNALGN
jgi:pilus assembly protein Flp/PilA